MRAPRDGSRRRGARRGARAHAVSAQGNNGDGDVCTDLSGTSNNLDSSTCETQTCYDDGNQADCTTGVTCGPSLPHWPVEDGKGRGGSFSRAATMRA